MESGIWNQNLAIIVSHETSYYIVLMHDLSEPVLMGHLVFVFVFVLAIAKQRNQNTCFIQDHANCNTTQLYKKRNILTPKFSYHFNTDLSRDIGNKQNSTICRNIWFQINCYSFLSSAGVSLEAGNWGILPPTFYIRATYYCHSISQFRPVFS